MKALPSHLFVSHMGSLHDTRQAGWEKTPLRICYRYHFPRISTTAELKATLRAGAHAWPGGYPLYFVTSDGCALSFETVREQLRAVLWSIKHQARDGWQVVACAVNWEDSELTDEHTGKRIESAYAP